MFFAKIPSLQNCSARVSTFSLRAEEALPIRPPWRAKEMDQVPDDRYRLILSGSGRRSHVRNSTYAHVASAWHAALHAAWVRPPPTSVPAPRPLVPAAVVQ